MTTPGQNIDLNIGDALVTESSWPYIHYGIVAGYEEYTNEPIIADNTPKVGGVRYSLLSDFLSKSELLAVRPSSATPDEIEQRLYESKNLPYTYLGNNCEHFANYVQYGEKQSRQADITTALGIGLLTYLIF